MTIQEFKTLSAQKLKNISSTPILDLNVLLQHLLDCDKTFLLSHNNFELSEEHLIWLNQAIEKRMTGVPVAYITGIKNFYGLDFEVTPDVLIPKPDTEILVERAINILKQTNENRISSTETSIKICDMCTGSGCIGITVLALSDFLPNPPHVTLIDISSNALEISKKNIYRILKFHNLTENINCIQSNLFENIPEKEKYDLILTNPPYIPAAMVDELLKDGRSEPRLALDGDVIPGGNSSGTSDGMEIIRNLIPQAKKHLKTGGTILMETGEYNAEATAKLAEENGFKSCIHKDLEGQLRLVEMK